MSAPDHIAATPLPGGLMHVFGVDHYGRGFSFSLDPLVLHECAPRMDDAAVLSLRGQASQGRPTSARRSTWTGDGLVTRLRDLLLTPLFWLYIWLDKDGGCWTPYHDFVDEHTDCEAAA